MSEAGFGGHINCTTRVNILQNKNNEHLYECTYQHDESYQHLQHRGTLGKGRVSQNEKHIFMEAPGPLITAVKGEWFGFSFRVRAQVRVRGKGRVAAHEKLVYQWKQEHAIART